MLKVASADKNWLQQTVLGERRRLAGLHRAALVRANAPNTETAKMDHKDDTGYEGSLAEGVKAPKVAAFTTPDDPSVQQDDIESVNLATEHLEDAFPGVDPIQISEAVHAAWVPGMSILDLISVAQANLSSTAHAASAKKAGIDPNTKQAEDDHKGDAAYETALKEASRKKADADPNTKQAEDDHKGDAAYETALKEASRKKASELKVDDQGAPPNTTTATSDHEDDLKSLASQLASFKGKLAFDPNDPLKD